MAVDIFLHLDDVKGESKTDGFIEEMDVLSWAWGGSQSGTTHMGSGGGSGKVSVQDLSVVKYLDKASATLLNFMTTGKHIPKGKLTVRKVAGDKPIDYVTIDLEEVMITSISTGGSGDSDRLTESVSLNFRKYKFVYMLQDDKGASKAGGDFSYDIAAQKKG